MMKDCLNGDAKSRIAVVAMVPLLFWHWGSIMRLAVRTDRLTLPSDFFKVGNAISFRGKHLVDFYDVHDLYLLLGQKVAQKAKLVKRNLLP